MDNYGTNTYLELQVIISFAKIILNAIQPGIEALGRFPGTDVFCDVRQYPMAIKAPGILTIRIKSSLLCFANANFIKERYITHYYVLAKDSEKDLNSSKLVIDFLLIC